MIRTKKITKRLVLYVASDKQGQTATVRIKTFPGSIEVGFGDITPLREELVAAKRALREAAPTWQESELISPELEMELRRRLEKKKRGRSRA